MQIDFEELRSVLMAIRNKTGDQTAFEVSPQDAEINLDKKKLYFYIELLEDDGLIEVADKIEQTHEIIVKRMTMDGFRTLEALENDTIWNKMKGQLYNLGVSGIGEIPSLAVKIFLQSSSL